MRKRGIVTAKYQLIVTAPTGEQIPVAVERKHVKNLNLRVRPDGSVMLSAPARASDARIRDFLDRHAGWICKHVERQRELSGAAGGDSAGGTGANAPGPGATVPLWGREIPLEELLGARAGVLSPDQCVHAVRERYGQEVARVLPGIAQEAQARMGVAATRWSVRTMKTRWGSCTPKTGAIRINAQLAAYPPECLQMVVVHELVHLMEPSHNARFHALLDTYCPDNRAINRLLKGRPTAQGQARP